MTGEGNKEMIVRSERRTGERKWVGIGIIPHVEAHPTQEDMAQRPDPVFERGVEVLRQKIKGN